MTILTKEELVEHGKNIMDLRMKKKSDLEEQRRTNEVNREVLSQSDGNSTNSESSDNNHITDFRNQHLNAFGNLTN